MVQNKAIRQELFGGIENIIGSDKEEVEEILLEILSLKSTFNYQQYEESLKMMSEPISPSQLPKVEIDLRGMIKYAKIQGSVYGLLS